ncbi:latent-transforming growth factor beta-binding protein 2 isoform X1 [Caretta caretta]|uniref:latent-transforming growth factor beta-binding protein 2 isoform X1 n=1 Tax=Caretta caretta TaxID=8467 RepID=UPI003D3A0ED9
MRGSWRSFLPLSLALFLGLGDSQRDFAGRFDPSSSFRTEAGSRVTSRLRLRNPGSNLGPTGKVYSLFRVHSLPSASEHLPAASPMDRPAWMRSLTGGDNREQPSVPPDHKLPAPQSARGQASNLRAAADSPDGTLLQTPVQRQKTDSSRQRQRNGLKARTVPRAKVQNARGRLMGPNVCGGQCCSGWTTAPGTNRCIKPVCDPPCQNKGSCSRPQLCICRSGFQGAQCEEIVPERAYHPPGSVAALQPPAGSLPKRAGSAEREGSPRGAQTPILQQPRAGTQGRIGSPVSQHAGSSRTVRRYPTGNTQLTSNALPNGNGHEQSSSGQHAAYQEHMLSLWGANLTEKIRKIKIVFTPTICKQTCRSGRCYNSCEKGDTTTLYSQGGQNHDPKSGFRIYFCQIPCLNGGRCVGRDECWCPSNSTGKFCHLPVPKLEKKQVGRVLKTLASGSMKQSMYTLPLSNQLASLNPSLVNVHINHPPEAIVQIHQVARVRGDSGQSEENSVEAVLMSQLPTGLQYSYSNGNSNSITRESGQQQRPPELMGRCFRETLHGQCANPLAGLAKFEDCCGSVGLFWGVNRCIPCPPRPAHPVIENRQVECPQGYKRLNRSHCQDINECLMLGLCKDAECVNTRGSFLCTCKPGTMLDPSRSRCVSDKAVSMEQGLCYRSAAGGNCALPLAQSITKQICCCSRVGKGWGRNCEKCPVLGSEAFKEICPAGHGYTYSSSDIRLSMRKAEAEELPFSSEEQGESSDRTPNWAAKRPQLQEALSGGVTGHSPDSEGAADATQEPATHPGDVVEETFSRPPAQPGPEAAGEGTAAAQITEIDRCSSVPDPCGPGTCVNLPGRYSCMCGPGYRLHPGLPRCIDDDECVGDPCAGKGHCINSVGSYSCLCYPGYTLLTSQDTQTCQDLNECEQPSMCLGGQCTNTPGSYHCECARGYIMGRRGQCEDVDECADPNTCPRGRCVNALGSYECLSCAAGYHPMNGRCVDDDECFAVGTCAHGLCINMAGSFRCSCYHGYEVTADEKSCQDIDECATHSTCPMGLCINTEGSFSCEACGAGYTVSRDGSMCEDIDECSSPAACPLGICTNMDGSFACRACDAGYMLSSNRLTCEDIDECEDPTISCLGGECLNTPGSYGCHCRPGFELLNGTVCEDMNECLGSEICGPNGECLNSHGSYFCICAPGFSNAAGGVSCQDVDECADKSRCLQGQCFNTEGSYRCLCENGFRHSPETDDCVDVDECADFGDTVCGTWRCQNTVGSYRCIMGCQPGFHQTPLGDCIDIDECANETLCGSHAFCDNTDGSFRCLCDSGYENLPPGQDCVDVNECELMVAVCGTALCENVEGSFLCLCLSDHEEYDTETGECRPRAGMGDPERPIAPRPPGSERKECYYHISDVQLCDSVLAKNTTKEECCCTEGAAWGDNCETHPCPILGTVEYSEICPSGKGYIPVEGTLLFGQTSYTDADECETFGSEICRNGHCVNTVPGYKCFCRSGYLYDSSRLECVDQDECENEMSCVNGECLNTAGSFHCFCSLPLVLDVTRNRCINVSNRAEDLDEHEIHLDICWQRVSNYICNQPLRGRRTTYTECCCRYGEAWSQDCALCPHRASEDFAHLCNVAWGETEREAGLQERPGYEYGPGLEDSHYGLYSPDLGPYYNYLSSEYGAPDASFAQRELSSEVGGSTFLRTPQLHPEHAQPRYLPSQTGHFDSFEGLQAEECGILNGCENGRCVRVREGYTCDCFDGFQLDMTHMACVDINECEVVSGPGPLCEAGTCENTEGSYRCNCSPGFVVQAEPHRCAPAPTQSPEAAQL